MSRHDPLVALRQMRDHATEAVELVRGLQRSALDSERMLNLSLVRLLEVVGEAAGRVPAGERVLMPEIPWSALVGMRNRLIHGYDVVDFDIVWQVVTVDLPPLIAGIDRVLSQVGA